MNNEEYTRINEYLDWYENLLTPRQREAMNLYYRENFSLSEVAENMSVSRSAVSDLIRRVTLTMDEYESNIHLVQKFQERSACYAQLHALNNNEVNVIVKTLEDSE